MIWSSERTLQHQGCPTLRKAQDVDLRVVVARAEQASIGPERSAGNRVLAELGHEDFGIGPTLQSPPLSIELHEVGVARVAIRFARLVPIMAEGHIPATLTEVDPS